MKTNKVCKVMEQQQIQQLVEAVGTLRSMLCDLQEQVQKLKEEREEEKHLPPYNPLSLKEEGREERARENAREEFFKKPTVEEVRAYLLLRNEKRFTAEMFFDHYESVGWMVGRNKHMKKWQSAVNYWISLRNKESVNPYSNGQRTETTRSESAREREEREDDARRKELLAAVARKLA